MREPPAGRSPRGAERRVRVAPIVGTPSERPPDELRPRAEGPFGSEGLAPGKLVGLDLLERQADPLAALCLLAVDVVDLDRADLDRSRGRPETQPFVSVEGTASDHP